VSMAGDMAATVPPVVRKRSGALGWRAPMSIETSTSWSRAAVALAVLSVSFGAPYVSVVALDTIASDLGGGRSVPALAGPSRGSVPPSAACSWGVWPNGSACAGP
jgi:hypothetical protein